MKKKQVVDIQNILSQVDQVSNKLKKMESELRTQEKSQKEKEEKEKQQQELERQEKERKEKEENLKKQQEEQHKQQEQQKQNQQEQQKQNQPKKESPQQHHHLVPHDKETTHKENQRRIGNFPLPSREDWKKLRYETEFEVKKLPNKYHLQSYIPNLDLKELQILEQDNNLIISGTRCKKKKIIIIFIIYLNFYFYRSH